MINATTIATKYCMCDFCIHEVHVLRKIKEKSRYFMKILENEYELNSNQLSKALEVLNNKNSYYCLKRKLVIAHNYTLDCEFFIPRDYTGLNIIRMMKVKI